MSSGVEVRTGYQFMEVDPASSRRDAVLAVLRANRGEWFKAPVVAHMAGLTTEGNCADVRRAAAALAFAGYPIVSSPSRGFCYVADSFEVEKCARSLESRANELLLRAAALRRGGRS
jgi:hypothetical protein